MGNARYTGPAVVLHWLVAALIIANVVLALTWSRLPDADIRPVIDVHKSIGITVLGLVIMRLLWRFSHRPPELPAKYQRWEKALSHGVHGLLYLIMFGMPLSGWIMDSAWKDAATHPMSYFGLFQWPRIAPIMHLDPATRDRVHGFFGTSHSLGAYALYALVFLHVVGALKHQWLDGDKEVQRMWFARR